MMINPGSAACVPLDRAVQADHPSGRLRLSAFQEVLLHPDSTAVMIPDKRIRAVFDERTVRVYQRLHFCE